VLRINTWQTPETHLIFGSSIREQLEDFQHNSICTLLIMARHFAQDSPMFPLDMFYCTTPTHQHPPAKAYAKR
jgi:hypothetical protein